MGRRGCAAFLVTTALFGTALVGALDAPAANRAAASGNTRFLVFNGAPGGSYEVRKNGSMLTTLSAAPSGMLDFSDVSQVADQYQITLTGVNPTPPSPPANLSATGRTDGCATLAWDTPAPSEYVSAYVLKWGLTSGAYTDSMNVAGTDVARVGNRSQYVACGFAAGHYFFALRARNEFGLISGLSSEVSADITTGTAQPPAPPTNVAVAEPTWGCARVTWTVSGSPAVTGYRLYYGGASRAYTDSLDTGATNNAQVCGLTAGRYYFALRSLAGGGEVSGYSQEVTRVMAGVDVAGPALDSTHPVDGTTNVPRNTMIYFVISDDKTGPDPASVVVSVGGQTPASVTPYGGPEVILFQCVMGGDLPADTDISVSVQAADKASPPNVSNFGWSFRTGSGSVVDTTPPTITAVAPTPGATGVRADADVVVSVSDSELGVDFSTLKLYINGTSVAYTMQGDPNSVVIRYTPTSPYAGTSVDVRVEACDLAQPANCATPLTYSFALRAAAFAGLPNGAIVPNGFWAGDPTRPLEVQNLPARWTVRIFDAAGMQVRRYTSNADGENWTWDFANSNGQRVARAIYLVRVTDEGGSLRQSGRFLVQSDP